VFVVGNTRASLTLANLTISDGFGVGEAAGAVINHGTLTATNCTFSSNTGAAASGGGRTQGGAIVNLGRFSVSNSTFSNNHVPSTNGGGQGGAISNLGKGSVSGSTFSDNSAASSGSGGAIVNDGVLSISGSAFSDNSGSAGGAIFNAKTLSVVDSTFLSNSGGTSLFGGGAIGNFGNKLSVTHSTFATNTSPNGSGGAIYNIGLTLSVTNSTFTNNSAALVGGAIESDAGSFPPPAGKLTVIGCTFAGNSGSAGGAISNDSGRLTVTNSTFAQNSASVTGGAIYNFDQLTVVSSTFVDNTSLNGTGAAIDNDGGAANASIKNTIIATTTSDENCLAQGNLITDKGHNIDSGASCGFSRTHVSLSSTDPQLDPAGLADNGGPTQTVAVESGSPAINAGDEGACKAAPVKGVDQRGFARPGTGSTSCTIGAYEFNSPGCPARQTACGAMNICATLTNDSSNCGACGNVCMAGQKCSRGVCK